MINDKKLTAIVFGSTGLTGHFVTELLLADPRYEVVKVFTRKELRILSGRVKQVIFDEDNIDKVAGEITGDHLFCCIGTTIKKAGSKEQFYKIDHTLVEKIAQVASINRVKSFIVISSIGANNNSRNFYLGTKGKMEESIKTFNFENLSIVRPSMLMGMRKESRPLEEVGKVIAKFISPLMFGRIAKYKPIHSATVAKAMITLANKERGVYILESNELEQLVKNN